MLFTSKFYKKLCEKNKYCVNSILQTSLSISKAIYQISKDLRIL